MSEIDLYNVSRYVQWAGSLAIAICCLLHFKVRPLNIRLLGFYAVTSVSFSMLQEISIIFFSNVGTNPIANGFVFFETWFFSLVFFFATKSKSFQRMILISASLYSVFYLATLLLFSSSAISFIRFGRDSLMILFAVAYFYYLIRKLPEENLLRFPMFWINSAIIFFFSGTFILSLMVDYIAAVFNNNMPGFWAFRNLFRFAFCMVLCYAGWLDLRVTKLKVAGAIH